jgi:hypothetical protein
MFVPYQYRALRNMGAMGALSEKKMTKNIGALFGAAIAICGLFSIAGTAVWWNAWAFFFLMILISVFTLRHI